MPKLPRVKPTKVIEALKRANFYIDHKRHFETSQNFSKRIFRFFVK